MTTRRTPPRTGAASINPGRSPVKRAHESAIEWLTAVLANGERKATALFAEYADLRGWQLSSAVGKASRVRCTGGCGRPQIHTND